MEFAWENDATRVFALGARWVVVVVWFVCTLYLYERAFSLFSFFFSLFSFFPSGPSICNISFAVSIRSIVRSFLHPINPSIHQSIKNRFLGWLLIHQPSPDRPVRELGVVEIASIPSHSALSLGLLIR